MTEEQSDYTVWLKSNPSPDLEALVAKFGGYNKITPQAWAEHDRAMEEWQRRRRMRAIGAARP